jgi:hypothetical protein
MATQITITDADLAALIQAAKATLAKYDALADKLDSTLDSIKATADTATTAIPQLQTDVKEIAAAAKTFTFTGPLGMHGGSTS